LVRVSRDISLTEFIPKAGVVGKGKRRSSIVSSELSSRSHFDDVFQRRVVDGVADQLVEFSTRGRVLNEKLKVAQ
jgi:hypothetical protein